MVIAEVADIQQVTTRSKGKMAEWDAPEAILKQDMEWIGKANERNVTEVREQMKLPEETIETTNETPRGRHYRTAK